MFVLATVAFAVFGCSNVNDPAVEEGPGFGSLRALADGEAVPENSVSVNLIAGRTEHVGAVTCWIRGENMYVLYSMDAGWKLMETQLVAAASISDIDLTKNGTPKIGHFPWKMEHGTPVGQYLYTIALAGLDFDYNGEMVMAAHADVAYYAEDGTMEREEGAWAYGVRFTSVDTDEETLPDGIMEKPGVVRDDGVSDVVLEKDFVDRGNWSMFFTVTGWQITVRELKINEVFFAGSDYSKFYFYDQFVELYNTSEDTLYLDGCIITRNFASSLEDIEDIDYVRAIYAFQFPGTPVTGREYPIYPGQHVVVAADAIDHSLYATNGVDLSAADWEFFNPLGSDFDNPAVPNVVSIHPTSTADFMINLAHNAVVLATGEDYWFETYTSGSGTKVRVAIPLFTVLDGVEYSYSPDVTKELTARVDAGLAGIGIAKYSAQSTERVTAGQDSNNSTYDFHTITTPTPGYQAP